MIERFFLSLLERVNKKMSFFEEMMMKLSYKEASPSTNSAWRRRHVLSVFGVDWVDCSFMWHELLHPHNNPPLTTLSIQPKHLLWAMSFLKTYNIEEVCGAWFGVSGRTFRKWGWKAISRLANLKTVSNEKKPV